MKFYLKNRNGRFDAMAEYDEATHVFTVLKDSRVSDFVSDADKFRGTKTILKLREANVDRNGIVLNDLAFKSPSTAANFVTGTSTNGCKAWKDEYKRTFKEVVGSE